MHRAYRWVPWLLVLGTASFLGLIWQSSRTVPEAVYDGKTLRQWQRELRHPDIKLRLRAAKQLGLMGAEAAPAIPALHAALKDADPGVRWVAARSLVRLGGRSQDIVQVLVQCLGIRNTRLEAAKLLVELGPASVAELTRQVDDPRSSLRLPAVEVLRDLGTAARPATPGLCTALQADSKDLRREAARALGPIGAAESAPALIQALADQDERVRLAAADSLVQLGPAAVRPLAEALTARQPATRSAAARTLAHIGVLARSAETPLQQTLQDADPAVRQEAARAIVLIGGEPGACLPSLQAGLQDRSFRWDAVDALVKIGPPAIPTLTAALTDPDEIVRADVARGLGQLGPAGLPAAPALIQALQDKDKSVRREAVAALGRIGPAAQEALPAMTALFKDPDALNRGEAAIALAHFGPAAAPAAPGLITNLADEDENVRQESAKALAAIGPAALAPLRQALQHDNEVIRQAAADLLERLRP